MRLARLLIALAADSVLAVGPPLLAVNGLAPLVLEGRELHPSLLIGFYGLEAASETDANRLEDALRNIWAYNATFDRARVHREGLVLVVVWSGGVSPEVWKAVNAVVDDRLTAP